jgi:tRNA threonylcarbamoyladenosine biosynthesis protein TsaE
MKTAIIAKDPADTFKAGEELGKRLKAGDLVLLTGGLGAGKTLLTKGILNALDFDIDEVTSPSFALVNLYRTGRFDVYHIDLWRLDNSHNVADAVGLDDILDEANAVTIIEWAERLENYSPRNPVSRVNIDGEGDEPRSIEIEAPAREVKS